MRLILWVTLLPLVLALVTVSALLRSDTFQYYAQRQAERLIESELGEQVSMTRVDVRLLPPRVDVVGLNLFHAPTGDSIVSAERASAPIRFGWDGPTLGQVVVQRPLLQLHIEEDGQLREFRDRKRRTGGAKLERLPLRGLAIADGTLRIHHPRGELAIRGLDLLPRGNRRHDLSAELDLRVDRFGYRAMLYWPDIGLGPDVIDIPRLWVDTPLLALEGRAAIPLAGPPTADLTLTAELDELSPALDAPRALHGTLHADLSLRGEPGAPVLRANLAGHALGLDVPGVKVPVVHYRFQDVSAATVVTPGRVDVQDLVARWGGGTIRATGVIDPKTRRLEHAHAIGDRVSLRDLLVQLDGAPTPWIDMLCDAEVVLSGELQPLRLEGDFDLAVSDLVLGDRPVHSPGMRQMLAIPHAWARGRMLLEADHILLRAAQVRGPGTAGRATVDIGFKSWGPLSIDADLYRADLSDFQPLGGVQLSGVGPIRGRIQGRFDALSFEGEGDIERFSVLNIPFADRLQAPVFRSPDMRSIELVGAIATVGQSSYGGDFRFDFTGPMRMDTELRLQRGRVEDIVGVFVDLPGLSGGMDGTLSLHGPVFELDGLAEFRFEQVDLWGERFDFGDALGFMDDGRFTLDDLRILRADGREGLILRGTVGRAWALDMELLADGLDLGRLDLLADTELPIRGDLAALLTIDNTLFDPAPHGLITASGVRYDNRPLADSRVELSTEDAVLRFDADVLGGALRSVGTVGLWGERAYRIDTQLDALPIHSVYPRGADGTPIDAVASGSVWLAGALGATEQPPTVDGTLTDVRVTWNSHTLRNQRTWTFEQRGPRFRLDDVGLEGGRTALLVSARGGDGAGLSLDGEGTVDLDLLRAVVPELQRAEGVANVQLTVEGAGGGVEAAVDVDVDADLLRYAYVPAALEDTTAQLHLTGDRFELRTLRGSIGGGTIEGGGHIAAEAWTPRRFDLNATIRDAMVQWTASLPPAIGDADLRFDGPVDSLLLSGDITVDEMTFADRIDWEDWVVEYRSEVMVDRTAPIASESMFSMDLGIQADRTIALRNNLAEGTASADLRIVGDTARPGLLGTARVEDGLFVLRDRYFRVDRGIIAYNDPWSWDPDIDFDLVTDIDSRNQRYRINYQVYGPFSNWRTTTRSDPPRPQADVNALLWFGVTTDELEQSGELSTAVAQGVADLLLTDLFASTQAGELGEVPDLLFDRIDVATGVNGRGEYSAEPRLVVSKRLPELADMMLTWEFNLGRPGDNFVRLDKRVGGIWSIAGWYATLQRERVLPIGGAYGVDLTARWELD